MVTVLQIYLLTISWILYGVFSAKQLHSQGKKFILNNERYDFIACIVLSPLIIIARIYNGVVCVVP